MDTPNPLPVLSGLRVVDLSDGVAGAFGTRLLGHFGADVILIERPGGNPLRWMEPRAPGPGPERSALFASLNTGKRSVVMDWNGDDGRRQLLDLLFTADVVVESGTPGTWQQAGIDFASLRAQRPSMVVCSVTPFGQDGPRSNWKADALTAFAAGGQLSLCGDEDKAPLKTAGHQAHYQGGLHVFASCLAAVFASRRTGIGDHIDLSLQEVQAACLEGAGPAAMVRGTDSSRTSNQLRATWGIYQSADGYIGVAAMARQTPSVYQCIGRPELGDDPTFVNLLANPEMNDVVEMVIGEWAGERTSAEIFAEAARHRAPFALIPTPRELLEHPALREAGFWREVDHPVLGTYTVPGPAFSIDDDPGKVGRAPLLSEHTAEVLSEPGLHAPAHRIARESVSPLFDGIRVLDLSQVWAGPYAMRFFGDMGADVIHIEGPSFPDAVRGVGRGDDPRSFNKSAYFNEYNRNKRGIALDIKRPEGRDIFMQLVESADVVLENWSVGVAESLGIGFDDLRRVNPRIVFVQMPGYGKSGPDAGRAAFGPAIEQMGGLVALQGYPGGPPHRSGISYGDPNAGVLAAGATALALIKREATGAGSHVVVRQRDNIINMVGEFMTAESLGIPYPVRQGNAHPSKAPHGVYRCRDDEGRIQGDVLGNPIRELTDTWMAISVADDDEWRALCAVVGCKELERAEFAHREGRHAGRDEIDAALSRWAASQDAHRASKQLQSAGVNAVPVMSPLMLVRDAHLAARGFFVPYEHPEAGPVLGTRPVWRLTDRPFSGLRPAPCFGQHNREILGTFAGCGAPELDALEDSGVIATVPTAT